LFGKPPLNAFFLKHKMTKYAKNWGEHDLWAPPGYTYGDYIEISDYIKISPIYKSFVTYKEKFCLPCRTTRSF